ncbi:hypothetical protein VP01_547g5 [Puccinia sorghi]|uniref:Uncharacterized protein n=1 Tax=Puccinia sorghi TaxID=27349 RepID=A0A0L6UJH0_9BASI|nr:hypothetical protein VP01_547g5 [Puccinia sorghi]
MDKYDELLKKLVFIEGKKPIFKIKHNKNTRGYSFVSEDDIILTEIAVNIIGSYYQTKNIEKWITLFGNSTNFIQFLMKLRHKQTGTMTLELAQATFYFLIPKIELFPWEMKTKIFNGEITNQAQRVFQHHSKIQLDSWIEDFQDKSTTE